MSEETIETQSEWNNGEIDGASPDTNDEDGDLKIGYPSGRSDVDTTMPNYSDIELQMRFDEDFGSTSSNDTVTDYSGNDNDGTTNNDVDTTADGPFSAGAYKFEPDSDEEDGSYVTVSDDGNLSGFEDSFSVSTWVYIPQTIIDNPDRQSLFSKFDFDSEDERAYGLDLANEDGDGNNELVAIVSEDGTNEVQSRTNWSMDEFEGDSWNHLVFVWEAGETEQTVYINGQEVSSSDGNSESVDSVHSNTGTDLHIGRHSSGNVTDRALDGRVSDFILFPEVALTESDAEELYFNGQTDSEFTGIWTYTVVDESEEQEWDELDFTDHTITIPTDDDVEVTLRSLDDSDNENDSTTATLDESQDTYDISGLADGHKLEVEFNMTVAQ